MSSQLGGLSGLLLLFFSLSQFPDNFIFQSSHVISFLTIKIRELLVYMAEHCAVAIVGTFPFNP